MHSIVHSRSILSILLALFVQFGVSSPPAFAQAGIDFEVVPGSPGGPPSASAGQQVTLTGTIQILGEAPPEPVGSAVQFFLKGMRPGQPPTPGTTPAIPLEIGFGPSPTANNTIDVGRSIELKDATGSFDFDLVNLTLSRSPSSATTVAVDGTIVVTGAFKFVGGSSPTDVTLDFIGVPPFNFDPNDPTGGTATDGSFGREFVFGTLRLTGVSPSSTQIFTATLKVPPLPLNASSNPNNIFGIGYVIDRKGEIQEPKHNNASENPFELRVVVPDGTSFASDLVALSVGIAGEPAEFFPGEPLPLTATFKNDSGKDAAGPFGLAFFFVQEPDGTAGTAAGGFFEVGKVRFDSDLAANTTTSVTGTLQAPPFLTPGSYELVLEVDFAQNVVETNENNNRAKSRNKFRVPGAGSINADLVALSVNASPSATIGQDITVRGRLKNRGPDTVPRTTVSYSLSSGFDVSFNDIPLDSVVVAGPRGAGIGAGATLTVTRTFDVPQFLKPGQYHIGMIVDAGNQIPETDEGNNVARTATRTVLTTPANLEGQPDLVALGVSGPARTEPGRPLLVSASVGNPSNADVSRPFNVGLFLSPDQFGSNTSAIFLAELFLDQLAAGQTRVVTARVPLPFLEPKKYYLGAIVDAQNAIFESNERNNKTVSVQPMVATTPEFLLRLPDLAIATAVGPTATTSAGQSVNIAATVKASGETGERFRFAISVFVSTRSSFDPRHPDTTVRRIRRFEGLELAAGQSKTFPATLRLPSDLAAGSYRIGFYVDPDDVIAEANEQNNTLVLTNLPFTVTAGETAIDDHPDVPNPNQLKQSDLLELNGGGTAGHLDPRESGAPPDQDVLFFQVAESQIGQFLTIRIVQEGLRGSVVELIAPPDAFSRNDPALGGAFGRGDGFDDTGFIGTQGPAANSFVDYGSGSDGSGFLSNVPIRTAGTYFVIIRGKVEPSGFPGANGTNDRPSTGGYEVFGKLSGQKNRVVDLIPLVISTEPLRPTSDDDLKIGFSIGNVGTSTATTFTYLVELRPESNLINLDGSAIGSGDLGGTIAQANTILTTGRIHRLEPQGVVDVTPVTTGPFPNGKYTIVLKVDPRNQVTEISESNNFADFPFRVGPPPADQLENDLVAFELSLAPRRPTTTTTLTVFGSVGNFGANPAKDVKVTLKRDVTSASAGRVVTSIVIPFLAPGNVLPLRAVHIGPLAAGRHNLVLIVDDGNKIREFDERNNRLDREFFVRPQDRLNGFDLVPAPLSLSPKRPTTGDEIFVSGLVFNDGNADSAATTFSLQLTDEDGTEQEIGTGNIQALLPGEAAFGDTTFGPLGEGKYELQLVVGSPTGEADSQNNRVGLTFAVAPTKPATNVMVFRGRIADTNGNPIPEGTIVRAVNRTLELVSARSVTRTTGTTGNRVSIYRTQLGGPNSLLGAAVTAGDRIDFRVISREGRPLDVIEPQVVTVEPADIAAGLVTVNLKVAPPKKGSTSVQIFSPSNSQEFFEDEFIFFDGQAVDQEGRRLTARFRGLVWSSDQLPQPIGFGEFFERRLPVGTHKIRLVAKGSKGQPAIASRTIKVSRVVAESAASLSVSGRVRRASTGEPVMAGWSVEMTNSSTGRVQTVTGTVLDGGEYRSVFSSATGTAAMIGDEIAVRIFDGQGGQVGVRPSRFRLSPRDIANEQRGQDFKVARPGEELSRKIVFCPGPPNLISVPLNPDTTGGNPYMASDLARDTNARMITACVDGTNCVFIPDIPDQLDFPIFGNRGYFISINGDVPTTVTFSGLPWPEDQSGLDIDVGFNTLAFPQGVPENTNSNDLQQQTGSDVVFISVPVNGRCIYIPLSDALGSVDASDRTSGNSGLQDGQGFLINTRNRQRVKFQAPQ